jgi:hypothetical protein
MDQNNLKIQEVVKLIGYILLFAISFLTLMRIDSYLHYKAIDECGKVSKYETTDKNARVSYPVIDIYEKCLKDKGIKK